MQKRQEERALKREEIKKFHEQKAADKRREEYELEAKRIQQETENKVHHCPCHYFWSRILLWQYPIAAVIHSTSFCAIDIR